jgi:hypothetical protein
LNGLFSGVESGFQELPGISTRLSMLEYSAARDQDFGTGTHYLGNGLVMDATVNFHAEAELAGLPDFRQQRNLLKSG